MYPIDKVIVSLKCCINLNLSHAVRLQMLESLTTFMRTFWSQLFILPKIVVEVIKKYCRIFLCSDSSSKSKKPLFLRRECESQRIKVGIGAFQFEDLEYDCDS